MRIRSQLGITIIEVIYGVWISGLILIAAMAVVLNTISQANHLLLSQTREGIAFNIRAIAWDPIALRKTIGLNPIMQNCLPTASATPVPALAMTCVSNQYYGVSLYDASGTQVSGPAADSVGVPTKAPVYYDINGNACRPASGRCAFAVTTLLRTQGIPFFGFNYMQPLDYPNVGPWGYDSAIPYDSRNPQYPFYSQGLPPEIFSLTFAIHYCAADSPPDPACAGQSDAIFANTPDITGEIIQNMVEVAFAN
jgi:hypothetical protein